MGDKEKKLGESDLVPDSIQKCRELYLAASDAKSNEEIKHGARLIAIAELNRWKMNPAGEESIIAELYPEQDPKYYFTVLEYVLRHFDTLMDAVQKTWVKEQKPEENPAESNMEIAPATHRVKEQVRDILN